MLVKPTQNIEVTVTFSAKEMEQLEAVASLHDLYVPEFIHRAALEAAHIAPALKGKQEPEVSWLTDDFAVEVEEKPTVKTAVAKPAIPAKQVYSSSAPAKEKPRAVDTFSKEESSDTSTPAKRGVVGEQSSLAKGSGSVWEIRQALGQERLHGLGWTREHLAYVLKLSVVGVRKLEHEGKSPVKSLVARQQLLGLAKAIKEPTPSIIEFIKSEEAAISKLK
jgi:hypothetical protein